MHSHNLIQVLGKTVELSEKLFDAKQEQDLTLEPVPTPLPRVQKQTAQDFYQTYHTAKSAYADYQEKAAKWEELMDQSKRSIPCMTEYRVIKRGCRKTV